MSLRTWTFKINSEMQIKIKAKKNDAEKMARQINTIENIRNHCRELTGVIGQTERSATYYQVFGAGHDLADEAAFEAEKAAFYASLPDVITAEVWPGIQKQIDTIYNRHLPVIDKRETPDERAETIRQQNEAAAARDREQQEKQHSLETA